MSAVSCPRYTAPSVELHHLHVTQLGAGAERRRLASAVATSEFVVSRYSRPAPRWRGSSAWPRQTSCRDCVPDERPATRAFVSQQINCERLLPDIDRLLAADAGDERPHDLRARGVPSAWCNAAMAVAPSRVRGQRAVVIVELSSVRYSSRISSGAALTTLSTTARLHRPAPAIIVSSA